MSMSPVAIPCAASITAFSPEPQTLLMVSARDTIVEAAVERRLARRVLPVARPDHVAHDALVDEARIDAGARHRFAHDQRAELRAQ